MNFNFSQHPEYILHKSLTKEVIDLYGIKIKFLITEKINEDKEVFGDFSHIKTDSEKVFEMFAIPENPESFDNAAYGFTEYGFADYNNIGLFVAADDFKNVCPLNKIISNLVVLPSNKVMEVTNVEHMVPGINNLFTYIDEKSVYKLTCVPYEFKSSDEIQHSDLINTYKLEDPDATVVEHPTPLYKETYLEKITDKDEETLKQIEKENYDALHGFMQEIQKEKEDLDAAVTQTPSVKVNIGPDLEVVDKDVVEEKPPVDKSEPDIWNGY